MKRLLIFAITIAIFFPTMADEDYTSNQPKISDIEFSNKSETRQQLLDKLHELAKDGNADAQATLSSIYRWGGKVEQDHKKAAKWAKKAAKQEHIHGQYLLGNYYYRGIGVKKNLKKAAKYFLLTAEKGYSPSQYSIAVMLIYGKGVNQDIALGLKYLNEAAKKGYASALY